MGLLATLKDLLGFRPAPTPAPVPATPAAGRLTHHERRVGDLTRIFQVYTPAKTIQPCPVLLAFHGGGGNIEAFRRQTQLEALADRYGFRVVWPQGTDSANNKYFTWNARFCCGTAATDGVDDVLFVRVLLTALRETFPDIDTYRIYATGHSNGGSLCHLLACELDDQLAAVAPVSGGMPISQLTFPQVAVPILHIHGLLDQNAPYTGGYGSRAIQPVVHPNILELMRDWATHNAATVLHRQDTSQILRLGMSPRTKLGARADLIVVKDGGHTWPGGVDVLNGVAGPVSSFNANEAIWAFLSEQSRR